jgi:hypothetical protein
MNKRETFSVVSGVRKFRAKGYVEQEKHGLFEMLAFSRGGGDDETFSGHSFVSVVYLGIGSDVVRC